MSRGRKGGGSVCVHFGYTRPLVISTKVLEIRSGGRACPPDNWRSQLMSSGALEVGSEMPAVRLAHDTGVLAWGFGTPTLQAVFWLICVMPGKARPGRKAVSGKRKVRVPRQVGSVGTVAVIRRVLAAGNIVKPATDAGGAFGTVPGNLLDWASFQATFARFRLLRCTNVYMVAGEFDTTPAYPTLWVYHDLVSAGAPASIADAFLKRGVRPLSFNATVQRRVFSYVPMVWTSTGFNTQVPAPQFCGQTASAFAPVFSSVGYWGQNYNTGTAAPTLMLLQEMLIEFSEPI